MPRASASILLAVARAIEMKQMERTIDSTYRFAKHCRWLVPMLLGLILLFFSFFSACMHCNFRSFIFNVHFFSQWNQLDWYAIIITWPNTNNEWVSSGRFGSLSYCLLANNLFIYELLHDNEKSANYELAWRYHRLRVNWFARNI